MLRSLPLVVALVVAPVAAPVAAQTPASVQSFGSPCPFSTYQLIAQGLPQVGSNFNLTGPAGCLTANTCIHYLLMGTATQNVPFPGPWLASGNGCPVLVVPDIVAAFPFQGFPIPNQASLIGYQFHLQAATLQFFLGFIPTLELSNGLTCTVGV